MTKSLLFGIAESSIIHSAGDEPFCLDTKFQMVRNSDVFDYIEKTPPLAQEAEYMSCIERYNLPIHAGSWFYTLGRDEELLKANLLLGGRLGSVVHNTQIRMKHADGHLVKNSDVAEIYLRAFEWGQIAGCMPCLEVHVNMWSEDFRRVVDVADIVESYGVPFRMTLDHSHVIFKIDNPKEQKIFNIGPAVESGALILDPFKPGNVCSEWIDKGFVWHAHARAAAPNNPVNVWAKHKNGTFGRGVQYPFTKPKKDEWHSDWSEEKLEPWKEVVRQLMVHHAQDQTSKLGQISTEFLPAPDYGGGARYSIFENSIACAEWLRKTWNGTLCAGLSDKTI